MNDTRTPEERLLARRRLGSFYLDDVKALIARAEAAEQSYAGCKIAREAIASEADGWRERAEAAERERDEARQDYLNERGHHAVTKGTLDDAEAQVDTLQRLAERATDALEAAERERDNLQSNHDALYRSAVGNRDGRKRAEAQRDELREQAGEVMEARRERMEVAFAQRDELVEALETAVVELEYGLAGKPLKEHAKTAVKIGRERLAKVRGEAE